MLVWHLPTNTGYFELFGVEDGVKAQLYKLASISLCSNTAGQVRLRENAPACAHGWTDGYWE